MFPIYLLIAIPFLLGLVTFEIVLDRVKGRQLFSFQDTLTNLSCGIGNQALNLFVNGLMVALYYDLYENLALIYVPATWWSFIICLIVFDLAFYWEHRLSHQINLLWGTHVVHHSSEEYNLSIALRRSWIANLIVIIFFLPIPFMGFHPDIFLATVAVHNVWQFIIHTKSIGKLHPIVEYIMHTPSHHRVHHGRDPKYIDKNYSGVFIFLDRIFGTFQVEEEEPTYGITTQLQTNNPGVVNMHYYADLFRNVGRMRTFKDKVKMLFARPGWFPEEHGGYRQPPEVDKQTYRKYRANTPRSLNQYVLVQFLVTFGLMIMAIVVTMSFFTPMFQLLFFLILLGSSVIPIALFDRKDGLHIAEYIRLAFIFLALNSYVYFYGVYYFPSVLISSLLLFVLNAIWFRRVWAHRFEREEGLARS